MQFASRSRLQTGNCWPWRQTDVIDGWRPGLWTTRARTWTLVATTRCREGLVGEKKERSGTWNDDAHCAWRHYRGSVKIGIVCNCWATGEPCIAVERDEGNGIRRRSLNAQSHGLHLGTLLQGADLGCGISCQSHFIALQEPLVHRTGASYLSRLSIVYSGSSCVYPTE